MLKDCHRCNARRRRGTKENEIMNKEKIYKELKDRYDLVHKLTEYPERFTNDDKALVRLEARLLTLASLWQDQSYELLSVLVRKEQDKEEKLVLQLADCLYELPSDEEHLEQIATVIENGNKQLNNLVSLDWDWMGD